MKRPARSTLPERERAELLATLSARFQRHPHRHPGVAWATVQARLERAPGKLVTLARMEQSGGEPDVVGIDEESGAIVFFDCAAESPTGRRSLCYDRAALAARKANKPANTALDLAAEIGIDILDEVEYRRLQSLGEFDRKTSSWVKTPAAIRQLGGALFCDRRYGQVFTYHNGADSYYAVRGFRGALRV